MHPEVEKLLKLQAIDNRLEILRKEVESRPTLMEAQDDQIDRIKERRAEGEAGQKDKKKQLDRADLEVKSLDEKLKSVRGKLNLIKTNNEFTAFNAEIARYEEQRQRHADLMETLQRELDEIVTEFGTIDRELSEARDTMSEEEQELADELAEIRGEAGELVTARDAALDGIPEEIYDLYARLFSRYRERSVVSGEGAVCSGCHMTLSPQLLNELKAHKEVITCQSCSRILYL